MIPHLFTFAAAVVPVDGGPLPERLLEGAPRWTTWRHFSSPDGTMHAGLWQSTAGKWRMDYQRWEFMSVQSGECVIEHEDGKLLRLRAGSTLVIEPGFKGTWQVIETMRKLYYVRQELSPP